VSSLRGNSAAVLSNRDCCEGSCVRQELSGSGLRCGDLHHVACWIHSSPSGDVLHVIGRFLSGYILIRITLMVEATLVAQTTLQSSNAWATQLTNTSILACMHMNCCSNKTSPRCSNKTVADYPDGVVAKKTKNFLRKNTN
jgi:hypothetical protein